MATWDIARGPMKCQRCSATIGAGEPYRLVAKVYKHCESCSVAADGQKAPPAPPEPLRLVRQPAATMAPVAQFAIGRMPYAVEREPGSDD